METVYTFKTRRFTLELASDYLGGCCYESAGSFRQDPYFYDMVRSAIKDARAAIRNTPRLRAA